VAGSVLNRGVARVEWGPAITGAFSAAAVAIVLGLFGGAFGAGGLGVLSGIWLVVTPFAATFIGAAVAGAIAERRDVFPTGVMVWCISLVAGALIIADIGALMAHGTEQLVVYPGALALAGLSAILGLLGAVVGSGVGLRVSQHRRVSGTVTASEGRTRFASSGDHPEDVEEVEEKHTGVPSRSSEGGRAPLPH
jgi:hypothetical protein